MLEARDGTRNGNRCTNLDRPSFANFHWLAEAFLFEQFDVDGRTLGTINAETALNQSDGHRTNLTISDLVDEGA